MAHVGLHHVQAKLFHHAAQLLHPFFIGGDLRFQVSHVLLWVARGVFAALQQRHHFGFAQTPGFDQFDVVDLHTLFFDARGKRRHGAGREPTHIGVVPARAHIKHRFGVAVQIHRGDDGDVG